MFERHLSSPDTSDYCQLRFDPDLHLLRVTWAGYVDSIYAREGATASLDVLRQQHCPYLLNDNTLLEGPWFDSLFWLAQEWGPAAAAAGLRCVAHVVRAGTVASTFMVTPVHHLFTAFEIQIFDNLDEATDWLLSCQASAR